MCFSQSPRLSALEIEIYGEKKEKVRVRERDGERERSPQPKFVINYSSTGSQRTTSIFKFMHQEISARIFPNVQDIEERSSSLFIYSSSLRKELRIYRAVRDCVPDWREEWRMCWHCTFAKSITQNCLIWDCVFRRSVKQPEVVFVWRILLAYGNFKHALA